LIALDTAPIIYYLEANPEFGPSIRPVLDAVIQGEIQAVVSSLIVTELLVHTLRENNTELLARYEELLESTPSLSVFDLTTTIAKTAAVLRAAYNLKTPDAIHLATALEVGVEAFITNDAALKRVLEVKVLTVQDLNNGESIV
jgi:predicted nucleic acid-binding protein